MYGTANQYKCPKKFGKSRIAASCHSGIDKRTPRAAGAVQTNYAPCNHTHPKVRQNGRAGACLPSKVLLPERLTTGSAGVTCYRC